MRSVLSAVLLFFSLGLLVGHAQSKAHLPEAKTDTIPVKGTDTIPIKIADTIPVKVADTIPVKTSDSLPLQVRDSLPNKLPDSTKVLTKADSLKLLVKKMAGREAIKIDTIRITIKDYQIISHQRDTTFVDTTLTIQKDYKYNYLRRDDFEYMPMANMGQPYTALGAQLDTKSYMPSIGAKARHFGYQELEDVSYYNVPTPLTEMMFKTSLEQGQFLDFLLTANTSRKSNFSIYNRGFRSKGKYAYDEMSAGSFIATYNYQSKDNAYTVRGHYAAQNIEGEEHGGLPFRERQFQSANPRFLDRSRIDLYFTNALSVASGKRVFLDQTYRLTRSRSKDSLAKPRKSSLVLGHSIAYETRSFQFIQSSKNTYFGDAFRNIIQDKSHLKTLTQEVSATFSNPLLGILKTQARLYDYRYYFNSLLITETQTIESALTGQEVAVGARYLKKTPSFELEGNLDYTLVGELSAHKAYMSLSYIHRKKHRLSVGLNSQLRMPDFNFLLYQSDYQNFNWQHTADFEMEDHKSAFVQLDSPVWGNLDARYTLIGNYTYFAGQQPVIPIAQRTEDYVFEQVLDNAYITPLQEAADLALIKVKYQKEFRLGHFALNNTVMYQKVSQENGALFVPEITTRNTLYFSKDIFNGAMFFQTGLTFKYFSSFLMNGYSPVLGEFYTQNSTFNGGYPLVDFFMNGKVKQTRIYLKAEHFNAPITGYDYYVAPGYPFRDFVVRFGLVWNFFK
jgi:hypothetical protein